MVKIGKTTLRTITTTTITFCGKLTRGSFPLAVISIEPTNLSLEVSFQEKFKIHKPVRKIKKLSILRAITLCKKSFSVATYDGELFQPVLLSEVKISDLVS